MRPALCASPGGPQGSAQMLSDQLLNVPVEPPL